MVQVKRGTAALEEWARTVTAGYRGVAIKNMTTSWKNGMAFCAIIHRFHPDLIDYNSLDENDIIGNCTLAFEIAQDKLEIPALLDPEDMLLIEVPDRLSILTYVSQYYHRFKNSPLKSWPTIDKVAQCEIGSTRIKPLDPFKKVVSYCRTLEDACDNRHKVHQLIQASSTGSGKVMEEPVPTSSVPVSEPSQGQGTKLQEENKSSKCLIL